MAGAIPAAITGSPFGVFGGGGGQDKNPDPRAQFSGWNPGQYGQVPGQMPGQMGVGNATPAHSFGPPGFNPEKNTLTGWGVNPGNPYKQTHAHGLDYNQMAGKLSNNKSWDPQDYFANANMNPRYAAFGGMPQGGMSQMMAERSHGGPGNSPQGIAAYMANHPGAMGGATPQGGKGAAAMQAGAKPGGPPPVGKGAPAQGGKGQRGGLGGAGGQVGNQIGNWFSGGM